MRREPSIICKHISDPEFLPLCKTVLTKNCCKLQISLWNDHRQQTRSRMTLKHIWSVYWSVNTFNIVSLSIRCQYFWRSWDSPWKIECRESISRKPFLSLRSPRRSPRLNHRCWCWCCRSWENYRGRKAFSWKISGPRRCQASRSKTPKISTILSMKRSCKYYQLVRTSSTNLNKKR